MELNEEDIVEYFFSLPDNEDDSEEGDDEAKTSLLAWTCLTENVKGYKKISYNKKCV